MYQFSKRLAIHAQTSVVEYNVDLLDIVSHRARSLLAAINALSLVADDGAWITVPAVNEARVFSEFGMDDDLEMGISGILMKTDKPKSVATTRVLTITDLKKEYALALAKLTLSRHLPELADSYSMISPRECVSMYVKCRLYEAAADMCELFDLDYTVLFVGLASNVHSSGGWELVKEYLEKFDGPSVGWKYHGVLLDAVYRGKDVKLPRWLLISFKV
jgi:nuclear pore complex protein Nup160